MQKLFSLVVNYGWHIYQIDMTNVFLNDELKEEIYMIQPQGFFDPDMFDYMCRLVKYLHGLKKTVRAWYEKLKSALIDKGLLIL